MEEVMLRNLALIVGYAVIREADIAPQRFISAHL
jgi:hypothetical protein